MSDGRLIVECYDHQGILINNQSGLGKLNEVQFTKNTIDFLKKNISYKIELSYQEGYDLLKSEQPDKLKQFVSDMPEYFDFEVYHKDICEVPILIDWDGL